MTDKKIELYLKQRQPVWNIKSVCFLLLGLISVTSGLILLLTFSAIINYVLSKELTLQSDTELHKNWLEPQTSIFFDVYMFNWTNPEDVYNPDVKPKFEEVGPYRYRGHYKKVNVVYNAENETITYENQRTYYYDESSPRNHSDVINSINVVALSAAYFAKDFNFLMKEAVKLSLWDAPIYIQKEVRELLFDGYRDNLVTLANLFPLSGMKVVPDKFGWFYVLNGTVGIDGVYTIESKPGDKFGSLQSHNYLNKSAIYDGDCSNINVSPGELYPRNLKPTVMSYYNPDMCRPMNLDFDRYTNIKGVPAYVFSSGINTFDNGTLFEKNKCYCTEKCLPIGVTQTCGMDYPLFYSLPHFYAGDTSYLDNIEGLNPQKDLHEFTMTAEPTTGAVINVSATLQFNLLLEPSEDFRTFQNVPKMLFPLFWFRQYPIIPDEAYDSLAMISNLPKLFEIISIVLIIIGVASILMTLLYKFISHCSKVKRKDKFSKDEIPLNTK